MPTDKRRIAAYLPEEIDKAFQQYKEERGISGDSQAIVTILAEHLGVAQGDYRSELPRPSDEFKSELLSELIGELPKLLENLKGELLGELGGELAVSSGESEDELLGKLRGELPYIFVDFVGAAIEPLRERLDKHEELISNLKSELLNELEFLKTSSVAEQKESQLQEINQESSKTEQGSTREQEEQSEKHLSDLSFSIKSDPGISPINGHILASRLGVSKDRPSGYRRGHTKEEFYEWSKKRDPDGIGWVSVSKRGYVPADELSGELLGKLQDWIREHS